jgi:hypothetical protein
VDGRLASGEPATDVSAGQWRSHVFMRESEFPAVHPRHERLKYRTAGPARDLLRFAGLGPYGQLALVRAEALMDAGFGPSVHGLSRGFLRMSFLEGRPLRRNDVTRTLLERMAAYLAYLKRHCATGSPASPDGLREMVAANVADIFGCDRIPIVERVMNTVGRFTGAEAVAVDGRMLPHDWIASDAGFHKTDALDHHRDDFFPGHEDIAWDVAGACVEFDLDPKAREYFVSRYRWHARDPEIERRLPFYRLAYLAYRIGYVSMASADLPDTPDGGRFRQLTARYRAQLERFLLIAPSVR